MKNSVSIHAVLGIYIYNEFSDISYFRLICNFIIMRFECRQLQLLQLVSMSSSFAILVQYIRVQMHVSLL